MNVPLQSYEFRSDYEWQRCSKKNGKSNSFNIWISKYHFGVFFFFFFLQGWSIPHFFHIPPSSKPHVLKWLKSHKSLWFQCLYFSSAILGTTITPVYIFCIVNELWYWFTLLNVWIKEVIYILARLIQNPLYHTLVWMLRWRPWEVRCDIFEYYFFYNKKSYFKALILALATLKSLRNMHGFFILTICGSYNVHSFNEITVGQDGISLFKFSHQFFPQKFAND